MRATLIKPYAGRLELITPPSPEIRSWLQALGYKEPTRARAYGVNRDHDRWFLDRQGFDHLVKACAERFGLVQVESWGDAATECNKACRNDLGDDCTCSCCGVDHGKSVGRHWQTQGDETRIVNDQVRRRYAVSRGNAMKAKIISVTV